MRQLLVALMAIATLACQQQEKTEDAPDASSKLLESQELSERVESMLRYPMDAGLPRCLEPDGTVREVKTRDWTSGFFPGSLWYIYELSGDERFKNAAEQWTVKLEPEQYDDHTHDTGFKINCSYGHALEHTGNDAYKAVMIHTARTLSGRFDPEVGCTRSWDFNQDIWDFPVIIDNMMNLELLFKATQLSGDSTFHNMAYTHAMTTLENHFREDNSSYHVLDYNPDTGEVGGKYTHQGYTDESSWARGQAWGLYGFTMSYRFTGEQKFLDQAVKIYDYIFSELPEDDLIPAWDYHDPNPDKPKDASAAAITASALYELAEYTKDREMIDKADQILSTLQTSYLHDQVGDRDVFILDHSTGNRPKDDEIDVPISYADYYFLEALVRQKENK
ncbi:glycoside hydrolase family 88 protein [Marinoscillum sp.]|uniref:glycoside hydrolase family 88 protein n=1 Tax=Marinoscillum sp. TaxID=2024838 RepID=UPI003BAD5717